MDILVSANQYEQKKIRLARELKTLAQENGESIRLYKTTSNLFRDRDVAKKKIDVRDFNQVIFIDAENHIAEIEGMATYEDIVKTTLQYGFLPTVVPQLKSITIGGALAGCGIESSSFRYGLTHETMLEYEVLLGDGRIITLSPNNEHKDLFYAFPNSYGTLGYALKIKVKLIPVKKYVKLTHIRFNNAESYFFQLEKLCTEHRNNGAVAFIDGVVFSENEMYITLGEFVDQAPFVSNYKYMNIYYQSICKKHADYLTTEDYIWRWDTDWFWCSKNFYMQNYFLRLLFGKFMLKSTVYWRIKNFFNTNKFASNIADRVLGKVESVVQDVEIPMQNAAHFLQFFLREIGIKPIWICPTKSYAATSLYPFYKMNADVFYVNFGFWDMLPMNKEDGYYNRLIENKVAELSGNKSLYSRVYYTEDEFWKIYDRELYDRLKNKYDPQQQLNNLYQKCRGRG